MFYSDSSRNFSLGFGAFCQMSWMQAHWSEVNITEEMNPSIQYLELYALAAAVLTWIHRFQNKHIIIFCDNEAMVNMVNNSSSSCKNCMVLIRHIVLRCLVYNVWLFVRHVESKSNAISESLSRFQNDRFAALTADMRMEPIATDVPKKLVDTCRIWID